jgi:hypothetical protein
MSNLQPDNSLKYIRFCPLVVCCWTKGITLVINETCRKDVLWIWFIGMDTWEDVKKCCRKCGVKEGEVRKSKQKTYVFIVLHLKRLLVNESAACVGICPAYHVSGFFRQSRDRLDSHVTDMWY